MILEKIDFEGHYLFRTDSGCCYLEPVFDEGAHSHDPLTFMSDLSHISCFHLYELSEEAYYQMMDEYEMHGVLDHSNYELTLIESIPYTDFRSIEALMGD